MTRLDSYNYMKNLTDWVPEEDIFKKDFVWPRQMEIHLPSNKEIACDFHCFYCQGSKLDMALGMDEKKALKLIAQGLFEKSKLQLDKLLKSSALIEVINE